MFFNFIYKYISIEEILLNRQISGEHLREYKQSLEGKNKNMEIIFDRDMECCINNIQYHNIISDELVEISKSFPIENLMFFYVSANTQENFENIVFSLEMDLCNDRENSIKNNVYGKSICQQKENSLKHAIVVKEEVIHALYILKKKMYISNPIFVENDLKNIAQIFYHEIGHVISDNLLFQNNKYEYFDYQVNSIEVFKKGPAHHNWGEFFC